MFSFFVAVQKTTARRIKRRLKWNRHQNDASECVWSDDVVSNSTMKGKQSDNVNHSPTDNAKKMKWNEKQRDAYQCGWDSETILDE